MTSLIIILIILLILLFLLISKVSVQIAVHDIDYELKVKYLFFAIFPFKERRKKTIKKSKKKSGKKKFGKNDDKKDVSDEKNFTDESSDENSSVTEMSDKELLNPDGDNIDKQGKLDQLLEKFEKIMVIVRGSAPGIKRVYNDIRIDDIVIDFRIAAEDPFKAAMKYGGISAATYNIISLVRCYFNLSIISVDINCLFDRKESTYDAEFKVNMTLSVLIVAGLSIMWNLYKNKDKITDKE